MIRPILHDTGVALAETGLSAGSIALVVDRFEATVRRQPEAVALVAVSSNGTPDEQITYGQLNEVANGLANRLISDGIRTEDIVAIAVEHDLMTVAAILAILKAGACFLPLDRRAPDARLERILRESGARMIVLSDRVKARFEGLGPQRLVADEYLSRVDGRVHNPGLAIDPQNPAYVIYTSGSTGEPKGVVVTHGGLANHNTCFATNIGLNSTDAVLQFASLVFDAAYEEIFPCLSEGGRLVLRSTEMEDDVSSLLEHIDARQVTILDIPTAYWHVLTTILESGAYGLPDAIRQIVIGGEAASPAALVYWQSYRGRMGILNTYGPTEGTIIATQGELLDASVKPEEISLGTPLANTAVMVCDALGKRCRRGQVGEIYLAGAGVARGYLNAPRLTAERFLPDPENGAGKRLYRTGDLAVWTEGDELLFRGRNDNQVKLNGHRVQLEEVEQALLSHSSIEACAVLIKDNRLGGRHLVAYCTLKREEFSLPFEMSPLSVMNLKEYLRERLPEYMVPSDFSFLEKFIFNAGGKIDRSKLPEIGYLNRRYRRLPEYQKLRSGLETKLAEIWCDVLDLDIDEVSAEDPFEYLGGNSLYSIQVRFKAKEAGFLFRANDLHLRQTVRGLAACCRVTEGKKRDLRYALYDYTSYFASYGRAVATGIKRSLRVQRRWEEKKNLERLAKFYGSLKQRENIIYIFFTENLLHWLATTLKFVPAKFNVVVIGSGLREEEILWVKQQVKKPFLHFPEEIDLRMIWDLLFKVNTRNFGWLDVDCFIVNPSIFDEMTRIQSDQAINCIWTHAACGPTKRPFHILESYFLFFNIAVLNQLKEEGILPRPSADHATLKQIEVLKRLIPGEKDYRQYFRTVDGNAFIHRLFTFDFAPLILYQLLANARGYKLNRVRFLTEIDSFNPYNYYSDEAIHVFPTIRHFDSVGWWGRNQKMRLTSDYLLMTSMLDQLPDSYRPRKTFLESKFQYFELNIERARKEICEYLEARGVSEKTFRRKEFRWLAGADFDLETKRDALSELSVAASS